MIFSRLLDNLRLLKQYFATPKGRHDIIDYARAILLIITISIVVSIVLMYFID